MRGLWVLLLLLPAAGADQTHGDHGVEGAEMMHNETWSYTFTAPGTFEYHCHPHPWMQASIEVLPADGPPRNHTVQVVEPEDYEQWSFDPTPLEVRVGDTVTWVNSGQVMHRVAQTTAEHAEHIAGAGAGPTHDDEHEAGNPWGALGIIGGGLAVGLVVAAWARRRSP